MALRMTKRFFFSCVTIFFVIAFNFFLFRVMPGNVETIIAKANTSSSSYAGITVYAHWSTTPVDPEIGSASGSKTGYTDVAETDWFADAVVEASRLNIFSGYPDGTFRPDETLTRAMEILKRYAPEKTSFLAPKPAITEQALMDPRSYAQAMEKAETLTRGERSLAAIEAERTKTETLRQTLAPWL